MYQTSQWIQSETLHSLFDLQYCTALLAALTEPWMCLGFLMCHLLTMIKCYLQTIIIFSLKKTNCDLKFTFTKADFIVYPVTMIYEEEGHMWESVYPQQLTKINPYEQNSSLLLPGMEIENLHHRGQVPNCPTGVLSPEFVGMCFSCALQNNNVKPVLETYNKTVTAERTERSKCGFISQRQVTVLVVNLQKIKIQTKKL